VSDGGCYSPAVPSPPRKHRLRLSRRPPGHPRFGRTVPVALIGLLAVVLVVTLGGCDVMTAQLTPVPSRASRTPEPLATDEPAESDEVPTPRPQASGGAPDFVDGADGLSDLDSYRVAVVSTGLVPASSADGKVSMTSTIIQTENPAAQFTMIGVDGLDGGRLDAIVIGDEAWLKPGGGQWQKSPGGAADFDAAFTALSPIDLAAGFESLASAIVKIGPEKKNAVASVHYRADSGDADAQAAGLTSGSADLWLARSGGYLVALLVNGRWDIDGVPTPVTLRIDVTHVNDRANTVKPPAGS
jgi:hypothetical protein